MRMRMMFLSAIASTLGMAQLATTHDDPLGGENNSVRLFFRQRTLIKEPNLPPTEVWQHTHAGATFLVVDPGNGNVRNIPLAANSIINIALGTGPGYKTPAGGVKIEMKKSTHAHLAVGAHVSLLEEVQRKCGPGPASQIARNRFEEIRASSARGSGNESLGKLYADWQKSTCPQARAEIAKHDLHSYWVTALSGGWTFANPTVRTSGGGQERYFIANNSGLRMTSISVAGQRVTLEGRDCARWVICSHEEVAKTGRPCALPPHSTNRTCAIRVSNPKDTNNLPN